MLGRSVRHLYNHYSPRSILKFEIIIVFIVIAAFLHDFRCPDLPKLVLRLLAICFDFDLIRCATCSLLTGLLASQVSLGHNIKQTTRTHIHRSSIRRFVKRFWKTEAVGRTYVVGSRQMLLLLLSYKNTSSSGNGVIAAVMSSLYVEHRCLLLIDDNRSNGFCVAGRKS